MKWKTNIINLNFQLITFPKMTSRWLFTIIFLFEAEHILILLPITIFTCVLKFWLTCFCVLNRSWKEYMYIYILHLQISAYSTITCTFVFTFPCLPLVCEYISDVIYAAFLTHIIFVKYLFKDTLRKLEFTTVYHK